MNATKQTEFMTGCNVYRDTLGDAMKCFNRKALNEEMRKIETSLNTTQTIKDLNPLKDLFL